MIAKKEATRLSVRLRNQRLLTFTKRDEVAAGDTSVELGGTVLLTVEFRKFIPISVLLSVKEDSCNEIN